MTVYLVVRVGVSDIKSRWQKMFESQCLDRETPTSTVWCPRFQLKSVLFTFIVDNIDSILLEKKIKNLKEINKQISPVTTSSNRKCWEYQSNMRWGRNALQWEDEGGEWLLLSRHFNPPPPALPPPPTTLPPTPTQPNTPFLHQLLTYPPMLEVYFISFQIVVCSLWLHISQCQPLCSLLFMNSVINSLQLRRLLQSTRRVITVQLNEGKHAAPANTNWNKIENTKTFAFKNHAAGVGDYHPA